MSTSAPDDDPRLAFVYQEALRGLVQQLNAVESLRARAGTLDLRGVVRQLAPREQGADGWPRRMGLGGCRAAFAIGALAAFILWPYYDLTFRFDPEQLLDEYVDTDVTVSMSDMHRALALRIKTDAARNGRIIRRIREALQLSLVLLLLEILAWLLAIARM